VSERYERIDALCRPPFSLLNRATINHEVRFRFSDPTTQPLVVMQAFRDGFVTALALADTYECPSDILLDDLDWCIFNSLNAQNARQADEYFEKAEVIWGEIQLRTPSTPRGVSPRRDVIGNRLEELRRLRHGTE
jgi:hypothetical protein